MPEFFNRVLARVKDFWSARRARLSEMSGEGVRDTATRAAPWVAGFFIFVFIVYYPFGMLIYNGIDDDLDIAPAPEYSLPGGSQAVAVTATVTMREARRWLPNKPFWHPSAPLDNTPNFQLGMMYAVSRFALELGDHLARDRGSSAIDANADRAAALLRYDGRIWYWGQGNVLPMAKAESQYERGVAALAAYNRDLAAGQAIYARRADNLIVLLDRIASDLGSSSAILDARASRGGGYWDTQADDIFYNVKGKLYGYAVILNAIGQDFSTVIEEKQAGEIWTNMLTSLRAGAAMDPLVVINGPLDSTLTPSHLAAMGSQVSRAGQQMRELADTLQK